MPWWPRLGWAAVTIVSSVGLRLISPARLRDWVDVRVALEAAVVAAVLAWSRSR